MSLEGIEGRADTVGCLIQNPRMANKYIDDVFS